MHSGAHPNRTDLKSKRILVTGGGGFLGTHIVEQLRRQGCEHICAPRKRNYDLTSSSALEELFGTFRPEIVIHAAAVVGGIGANRNNPGLFFYENALMGIQLIEACRRHAVQKTVVLGTICSYPKNTPVPFQEDDLWNGYPEETNAPYGIAKKALLVQCQAYRQQYGMSAIYLMPVNLYGPGDNFEPESSHVVPAIVRKCLDAQLRSETEITLWGDGSPTREFIYVADAAEAIVRATEAYDGFAPVNIGCGQEVSIKDLAQTIANQIGYAGKIQWDTSKPNGQPRRCLDTRRAENEFGFKARTPLDVGLQLTIEWCRTHLLPASGAAGS